MGNLENTALVKSAEFEYGDQSNLVKMIRLLDPSDLDFSLRLSGITSPRMQEIYSKICGFRGGNIGEVDSSYQDTALNLPLKKSLPLQNPRDILPQGIRNFIADLDEFIQLSKQDNIVPLLRIVKEEDRTATIEISKIYAPTIDNQLNSSQLWNLNRSIELELYAPRFEELKSIGALARGLRPGTITYLNIRGNPEVVKDCFRALDSVPEKNIIDTFRIGSEPRDEGGREYYDWRCSTVMQMQPWQNTFTMQFKKPTDVRAILDDFEKHGVYLKLVEN